MFFICKKFLIRLKLEVTLTSIDTIMFSIVKNNLYASCYAWDG